MNWVTTRDDPAELLPDLSRPSPPPSDFSPLVSGLLAPTSAPPPPVCTDWPLSHATSRSARNDFRYEYSLSAGPEFDTDSAHNHDHTRLDEDDISTDWHGAATASEDTSLGLSDPSIVSTISNPTVPPSTTSATPHDKKLMSPTPPPPSTPPTTTKLEDIAPSEVVPPVTTSSAPASATPASAGSPAPPTKTDASALRSTPSPSPSLKPAKKISKKKSSSSLIKAGSSPPPAALQSGLTAGSSGGATAALSHTKLCRDRLNNMFERLRHTLPPAPAGIEVKHKAQVLDYAIMVLRSMVDRTSQLEIELAVSSNKATMDWISKLVSRVDSFPLAAEEVMRLFTKRRAWMHAELWVAGKRLVEHQVDPDDAVVLSFCTSVRNETMPDVGLCNFSKESETHVFRAKEGVPGRVWSSMRPEWVTGLSDLKNFRRASLARKYGLKVCLAVPITITGKIEGVMCFYDVKHRPYDMQCLELAMRLAWALGNAIGGKRAKVNYLTTSGTSST